MKNTNIFGAIQAMELRFGFEWEKLDITSHHFNLWVAIFMIDINEITQNILKCSEDDFGYKPS